MTIDQAQSLLSKLRNGPRLVALHYARDAHKATVARIEDSGRIWVGGEFPGHHLNDVQTIEIAAQMAHDHGCHP